MAREQDLAALSRARELAIARAGAVAGVLALLVTMRALALGLSEQPSKPVDLGGHWQLNAPLSDDVHALVAAQQQKLRGQIEHARHRAERPQGFPLYPTEEEVLGSGPIRMTPEPLLTVE